MSGSETALTSLSTLSDCTVVVTREAMLLVAAVIVVSSLILFKLQNLFNNCYWSIGIHLFNFQLYFNLFTNYNSTPAGKSDYRCELCERCFTTGELLHQHTQRSEHALEKYPFTPFTHSLHIEVGTRSGEIPFHSLSKRF